MGNGLGPEWFPKELRDFLTRWASSRYPRLAWQKHDASYAAGSPERWRCDFGFVRAMLSDMNAKGTLGLFSLTIVAYLFWVAVRLFGWTRYGKRD